MQVTSNIILSTRFANTARATTKSLFQKSFTGTPNLFKETFKHLLLRLDQIQQRSTFTNFTMPQFSTDTTSGEQNHILLIRMDNAKIISHILKAINFKEVELASCTYSYSNFKHNKNNSIYIFHLIQWILGWLILLYQRWNESYCWRYEKCSTKCFHWARSVSGILLCVVSHFYLKFYNTSPFKSPKSYVVKEEEIKFQLNLTVLLECLNVFGSNTLQSGTTPALKLYFNGHGTPVTIL